MVEMFQDRVVPGDRHFNHFKHVTQGGNILMPSGLPDCHLLALFTLNYK